MRENQRLSFLLYKKRTDGLTFDESEELSKLDNSYEAYCDGFKQIDPLVYAFAIEYILI